MRLYVRTLFALFLAGLFVFGAYIARLAADSQTVEGKRTEQGFEVKEGNYVAIPADVQMKKVATNVITPEPPEDYLARKVNALEENFNILRSDTEKRMKEMEGKLAELEARSNKPAS